MSFNAALVRSVIRIAVAAVILTLMVNVGYGLAFLVWRGVSLPEVLRTLSTSAPFVVLGFFLAVVGAILGNCLAAYRPGPGARLAGLTVGVGLALTVIAVGWLRGSLDFWLPPNAAMAMFGGWWGASLGAHT